MISHHYRCIFIHIPKCAGTSIEQALGHWDGISGRGGQDHRPIRWIEPLTPDIWPAALRTAENRRELVARFRHYLAPLPNPRNKWRVTPLQYLQYFKFAVVRNPWARAYSWYRNVLRDARHQQTYGFSADISFADFLPRAVGRDMLRPQTYWLRNFRGHIPLNFIIRFENLHEDFAKACEHMGISPLPLPHALPDAQKQDYRTVYTRDLRELVANVYREEIALFGYTFEI